MRVTLFVLAMFLLAVGCADPHAPEGAKPSNLPICDETPLTTTETHEEAVEKLRAAASRKCVPAPFFGGKYSPDLRVRIDTIAAQQDCRTLLDEVDRASINDANTRDRTGSGTADLVQYITAKLRDSGCVSR